MLQSKTVYDVWKVDRTTALCRLTIEEGGRLEAPAGKYLTLTVNGCGRPIEPGTYKGDVVVTVSDCYHMAPHGLMKKNNISRDFHCALVVEDGRLAPEKGVAAIVQGGAVSGARAEGIYIASEEESFNGILVTGSSDYEISNVNMDLDGFGANDFLGVGSAVAAIDNAKVTINNSTFNMSGVTRCAVHVGGDSVVTLNNCKLINHSPDTDWLDAFSWAVGFTGSNRLAQLADNGTVYYNNCTLKTNGWGVLSIDGSDKGVSMFVKGGSMELSGPRAHGYGAFCIGDNRVRFDGVAVNVNGYPMLLMGKMGKGRAEIVGGCVIRGRRFGAMVVGDEGSVFTISDSTFNTDKSVLVVKGSAGTAISIDKTAMHAKNGVLVQLMDSDETGMNSDDFKIPVGVVDVPVSGRDLTAATDADIRIAISDCTLEGDIYNSTTNIRADKLSTKGGMGKFHDAVVGVMSPMPMDAGAPAAPPPQIGISEDVLRGPKNLALDLKNTKIKGVVSAAVQAYRDGINTIDESTRLELSNITQTAAEPVNNGVIVSLDGGSVWTVTGTSYITRLELAPGAVLKAPEGKTLIMLLDGTQMQISPGVYKGNIQMVLQ